MSIHCTQVVEHMPAAGNFAEHMLWPDHHMQEFEQGVAGNLDNSFADYTHTQKHQWELQSPEGFDEPAGFAGHRSHKRTVAGAVQQKQVTAAPNQRNNHQLAVEKTGHKPGGGVAGTVEEDLDNEEAADIHKAEAQQEDPTAEDPKACIHLPGVDCSYLEAPLRYDSRQ